MGSHEQIVRLPQEALPQSAVDRQRLLSDFFPDKRCEASEDAHGWAVRFRWPTVRELVKDPCIPDGLSAVFGDDAPEVVGTTRPLRRGISICLNDSWTLLNWSEALADCRPGSVVVIHIDAHSDLMSPLLEIQGNNRLRDLISGNDFNISTPSSVSSAIESGAIGIGSFVVPFLWQAECEMLVHICNEEYAPEIRGWGRLLREALAFPPFPSVLRPAFRRSTDSNDGGIPHLVAERISPDSLNLEGKMALVHIDLDFFNNRIDGDSHWHENLNRHDPPLEAMLSQVDLLIDDLMACGLENCVEITIACSPEFCPAEYWASLLQALEARFSRFRRKVMCSDQMLA